MPTWVKVAQDAWTAAAGVNDGFVFRPVIGHQRLLHGARYLPMCRSLSGNPT
jgi:hypothetical protein